MGAGKIVCQRTVPNKKASACTCDFVMPIKIKSTSETSKESVNPMLRKAFERGNKRAIGHSIVVFVLQAYREMGIAVVMP